MSKPSFLTESLGRRFLSIAVVSVLTLITAVSGVTASQEGPTGDRQRAFRRLVQTYVQTGKAEYDKRYFEEARKTFLMAKPYREYLTGAEREQLDALIKKTQTAIAERKHALETFQAVNSLIKQEACFVHSDIQNIFRGQQHSKEFDNGINDLCLRACLGNPTKQIHGHGKISRTVQIPFIFSC